MTTISMPSSLALVPSLEMAWQDVDSSFERFCLTAGIGAIEQMPCAAAQQLAGAPHSRGGGRVGHRWGRTKGKIGFHGGHVAVPRAGGVVCETRLRMPDGTAGAGGTAVGACATLVLFKARNSCVYSRAY